MNLAELDHLLLARQVIAAAVSRGLKALAAPVPQRLSEWAEAHFYLSAESSYVEKRWESYPFQRGILDCLGNDAIRSVWLRKSARVGYTKMLLAAMGYFAEHKRRNQVIYQPTDDDADEFVKTELEPMLRDVPVIAGVFKGDRSRDKDNTLKAKKFLGSITHIRGGKAAKNYRRLTVDVVYLDELDGFDRDIESEGSPTGLSAKRLEGATFPKQIGGSTPKLKGLSLIEEQEEAAVCRLRYHIRCPHCSEEHPLTFGGRDKPHGFKWVDGDPDTVRHLCPHCGALITQSEYRRHWEGRWKSAEGVWLDEADNVFRAADGRQVEPPLSVGFHLWSAYSPQVEWSGIVRDFLFAAAKAKAGDDSSLKTFINTTLGETYEVESEKTEPSALKQRAEPYDLRTAPRGVLVVTAAVDVQVDRWEIGVWGWGRGEEGWVLDHLVLHGNPADETEWDKVLLPALQGTLRHASGATLKIEAAAIDTGGHYTHQAYSFVRRHARMKLYAIKGDSKLGGPVKGRSSLQDINFRGAVIKRGVRLWLVGVDTAKDLLHGRLQVAQPGPGYVHFSQALDDEFYAQLTAEQRIPVRVAGGEQYRWVKRRKANEAWDVAVYNIFVAHQLDLHRYTDKHWARLEQLLQPSLFDAPAPAEPQDTEPPAPPPDAPRAPRRVGRIKKPPGFVGRW